PGDLQSDEPAFGNIRKAVVGTETVDEAAPRRIVPTPSLGQHQHVGVRQLRAERLDDVELRILRPIRNARDPPVEVPRKNLQVIQMPMRCASSSRWYVASPRKISVLFARLKYRCASCSHVNPIPPWIWMFSAAQWKYASEM